MIVVTRIASQVVVKNHHKFLYLCILIAKLYLILLLIDKSYAKEVLVKNPLKRDYQNGDVPTILKLTLYRS